MKMRRLITLAGICLTVSSVAFGADGAKPAQPPRFGGMPMIIRPLRMGMWTFNSG